MNALQLTEVAVAALEDIKAVDIRVLDIRELTTFADYMVIATGRSPRQVRASAARVEEFVKQQDVHPLGSEGLDGCSWVLIDLDDVIVHVMLPETREFYQLEKLWDMPRAKAQPAT